MSTPYAPTHVHPQPPVAKPVQITKVLGSAGPEQVTTQRRLANVLRVGGFKGNATANGADIFIGFSSAYQPYKIPAGGYIELPSDRAGYPIDTEDLFIRGTSGDGVVIEFAEGATIS